MPTATNGRIDSGGKRIIIWFSIEDQDYFFVYDGTSPKLHSSDATLTYDSTDDLRGPRGFTANIHTKNIRMTIDNGPVVEGSFDTADPNTVTLTGTGKWTKD